MRVRQQKGGHAERVSPKATNRLHFLIVQLSSQIFREREKVPNLPNLPTKPLFVKANHQTERIFSIAWNLPIVKNISFLTSCLKQPHDRQ